MAVFQRNSSICTLAGPGGSWVGARETLSVVSLPPFLHPSSFRLHPSSRRWSPWCAGCSGTVTHRRAEGAARLDLVLDQHAPCGGLWSGAFGRVPTDISAHGRLTVNLIPF